MQSQNNTPSFPAVVAHRGASWRAPENSLLSFELAWEEGADYIEGDFRLTADEKIVCIHDATTERIAPEQQIFTVERTKLAELRQLDIGTTHASSKEVIPTLQEVVATIPPEKGIYIELKDRRFRFVEILAKNLAELEIDSGNIRIISFCAETLGYCKSLVPGVPAYLLYEPSQPENASICRREQAGLIEQARRIGADGLDMSISSRIDREFCKYIRSVGLELHLWTVNQRSEAARYRDIDVVSLTTDRPGELRRWIYGAA